MKILLVSQFNRTIVTTGGMKVIPDGTFENCSPLDILVVPGGWGARNEMHDETMLSFVRAQARDVEKLASVCTGALKLGDVGLLDGLRVTTH